jgi:SPP1 family predicted phage head-tail adaptor
MNISGPFNRRISIQSQATSQDATGQEQQTWGTVYSCWANIDVQQSQLIYSTAEFVSKVTHRITIRWTSSIVLKPNMRIVYTEPTTSVVHTYEIEALINPQQGNVWLTILCYELNANE